jgi:hypothetical protein
MSRQTLPLSIHVGIQTLRANPLRTVLSTLCVVVGAASLVAVLSIGDEAERLARQQIVRRGLAATRGNDQAVGRLFGMPGTDDKPLLNFLGTDGCVLDFREFRTVPPPDGAVAKDRVPPEDSPPRGGRVTHPPWTVP